MINTNADPSIWTKYCLWRVTFQVDDRIREVDHNYQRCRKHLSNWCDIQWDMVGGSRRLVDGNIWYVLTKVEQRYKKGRFSRILAIRKEMLVPIIVVIVIFLWSTEEYPPPEIFVDVPPYFRKRKKVGFCRGSFIPWQELVFCTHVLVSSLSNHWNRITSSKSHRVGFAFTDKYQHV